MYKFFNVEKQQLSENKDYLIGLTTASNPYYYEYYENGIFIRKGFTI